MIVCAVSAILIQVGPVGRAGGPVASRPVGVSGGGVADPGRESLIPDFWPRGLVGCWSGGLRPTGPRCWVWQQFADEMLSLLTLSDEQAAANTEQPVQIASFEG